MDSTEMLRGTAAEPPMDVSAALAHAAGDRGLLGELLEIFLHEGPRHLRELEAAAALGDRIRIHRAAHTLKGELAVLHAARARALAERLEAPAREGAEAPWAELLAALEPEVRRLLAFVGRELGAAAVEP